jgi:hypothetical protein
VVVETPTPTNTPEDPGRIRIIKDTDPESNNVEFDFDSTLGDFDLEDDESTLFSNLDEGTYTFTENETGGWNLIDIDCSGGSHAIDLGLERVRVFLDSGDDVTCTFFNEEEFEEPDPTNTPRPANTPTRTPVAQVSAVVATPTVTVIRQLPSTGSGGYGDGGAALWLGLGLMAAGAGASLVGFHVRKAN